MNTHKILVVLILGILIFSTTGGFLGAGEIISNNTDKMIAKTEECKISLSKPIFTDKEGFVEVNIEEQTSFTKEEGKPMLPVIIKVFTFPVGTVIKNVNVNIDKKTYTLDKKVLPSPIVITGDSTNNIETFEDMYPMDEEFYENSILYPTESYEIKRGSGLIDGEHSIIIYIRSYVQYSSVNNEIYVPEQIQIDIEYEEPTENLCNTDEQYDLIIITHEKFEQDLQKLVDHKNNLNPPIKTIMVTVDEIYDQYDGVADWEEIKMYLADHVIDWNVQYVLLAGGRKGQTNEWWVPDFRSHNSDPSDTEYDPPYDITYSADLYFADVYYVNTYGKLIMDDWDTNDNGVYGEGPLYNPSGSADFPDFIPDVAVGRLPFRYSWEVSIAVDKIINYENNADPTWFNRALLAGGDGFPPERYPGVADPEYWEGEMECDEWAKLLAKKGITSTKCYCSDEGDVLVQDNDDIVNVANQGYGWVHLTGHASPMVLGSYRPGTGIVPPILIPFYNTFDIRQWDNQGKLSFMICEGCHNSQFDVTFQNLMEADEDDFLPIFGREEWIPHDASSWFVLQKGGGAIAVIGNTALGSGGINEWALRIVGGWMMYRFANAYVVENQEFTGTVWKQGIIDYVTTWPMNDMTDRKTAEERVLLGDPSVKLGGYGVSIADPEDDREDENIIPVSIDDVPIWEVGDSWTYNIDKIDLNYDGEVEGRTFNIEFSSGDIKMEIVEVSDTSYTAEIISDDIDLTLGLYFDYYMEDKEPINIPTIKIENVSLNGKLIVDKETLGIENVEIDLAVDIMENINNLPIELPKIVQKLKPFISLPANIKLTADFENAFQIIQFPLDTGNIWGIQENTITIAISGSVKSIWLRILNLINKFIPIIPEELAKYLPNIDIAEILNDFGIPTEYTIEIPSGLPTKFNTAPIFEAKGEKTVNVPAGNFNTALISMLDENGNIYYSPSVDNVVKLSCPLSDYIPIFNDLNLVLKSTNQ